MRRFIIFILVCSVSLFSVIPANATSISCLYNLLDYSTLSDSGGNQTTLSNSKVISYTMPGSSVLYYVDVLFTFNNGTLGTVNIGPNSSTEFSLTVENVSDRLYRAYGSLPTRVYGTVYLKFTNTLSSTASLTIHSINVSAFNSEFFDVSGKVYAKGLGSSNSSTWNKGGTTYTEFPTGYESGISGMCEVYYYFDDWSNYDYITLEGGLSGFGINSLYAFLEVSGISVPVISSYVSSGNGNSITQNWFTATLDLTGVRKNVDDYLVLYVSGTYDTGVSSYAYAFNCYGQVELPAPSQFSYLFTLLKTNFSNIISRLDQFLSGSSEHENSADGFNESAFEQSNELAEMSAVMNSVEPPDLSGVNMSVGSMVDASVITLTTTGLSNALSNDIFIRVLIMAITLGLAGFILYGKK